MLTATMTSAAAHPALRTSAPAPQRIADTLQGLQAHVDISRRVLHAGDRVYRTGDAFASLHVINSGFFKTLNLAADGREQVVGLHFKGDWLGFDGIATGRYGCDAIALDTGEVWSVRYDALLAACARHAPLLGLLHSAMSREISRDRDSLLSLCTLSADARVADFLRYWAEAMAQCGLRSDQITLRMTRAEIGNYLGMTVETVSRALTRLAREQLIAFTERGRRDICIPDVAALGAYVQRGVARTLLQ
ncbi:Crp/Fnr family transcriptional regulator [Pelomonas sp. Root1217]|uniref:Crp/Fnr family transcriptional regulator n=1 Tax=Pelomonas sp. Root1217 TaxID=1736430 RepID=UPI00070D1736|nr:helix-turn-helix domain-containing protein [Pelomonas sp. Root1217]KQV47270.1 Crp/Fnr family transcriptional regulator [Pelomonas sp. Root1217]